MNLFGPMCGWHTGSCWRLVWGTLTLSLASPCHAVRTSLTVWEKKFYFIMQCMENTRQCLDENCCHSCPKNDDCDNIPKALQEKFEKLAEIYFAYWEVINDGLWHEKKDVFLYNVLARTPILIQAVHIARQADIVNAGKTPAKRAAAQKLVSLLQGLHALFVDVAHSHPAAGGAQWMPLLKAQSL